MYKSYQLTDGKEPISHAEIDYLAELAKSLPDEPLIINIGAYIGVSTCTFLEAKPDCVIFSVDVEECVAEFDNAKKFGFDATRIKRVLADSKVAGKSFPYQADMIFCDGDHWGAGEDIKAWVDKIKPGGIMVFHDYQEVCAPNNPGSVYEDVNEGMKGYEQIGRCERVVAFRI